MCLSNEGHSVASQSVLVLAISLKHRMLSFNWNDHRRELCLPARCHRYTVRGGNGMFSDINKYSTFSASPSVTPVIRVPESALRNVLAEAFSDVVSRSII